MLIAHLPADSATSRSTRPDEVGWGITEYLLAEAVDALRAANWQRAGDKKKPRPEPIDRPGLVRRKARRQATPDEMARRLLEQKARVQRKR